MTANTPSTDTYPRISVVITIYDLHRYEEFSECVESVRNQTYDSFDIVIVTETDEVHEAVTRDYNDLDRITIHHLTNGENLATARNAGAEVATGDVVAFIDDDATAHDHWLDELARGYQETSYQAVGGKALPEWLGEDCTFLPEEFYFLVGATHKGFADGEGEVRNTFGCNISFDRDLFCSLGGFDESLGKDHGKNLQAEETEFCTRLRDKTGDGVYYVPSACVDHKVYESQTSPLWLLDRAFWQGYSKAIVDEGPDDATDEEWGFLGYLLLSALPWYVVKSVGSWTRFVQLVWLMILVISVGAGFLRGKLRL